MNYYERLSKLGLAIPELPRPVASYVPAKTVGNLIYASGQTGTVNQKLVYVGTVGAEVCIERAVESARLAALNCLAEIEHVVADLNRIEEIVRLTGYVASAPDFFRQPAVIEGASRLMLDIFGDRGTHARSAVGVATLPFNAPVELEIIALLKE